MAPKLARRHRDWRESRDAGVERARGLSPRVAGPLRSGLLRDDGRERAVRRPDRHPSAPIAIRGHAPTHRDPRPRAAMASAARGVAAEPLVGSVLPVCWPRPSGKLHNRGVQRRRCAIYRTISARVHTQHQYNANRVQKACCGTVLRTMSASNATGVHFSGRHARSDRHAWSGRHARRAKER